MEISLPASVEEWLISIKMEEYIDLFELNKLKTVHQLWDLDEDTLLYMGVNMRGHRKRILTYRPESEFKDKLASAPIVNEDDFLIKFDEKPQPPVIPPRIVPQIPPRPPERTTPEPVPRRKSVRPVPTPGEGRPVSSFPRITGDITPLRERPIPQPRKGRSGAITNGNQQEITTNHSDHPVPAERRLLLPPLPGRPHSEGIPHTQLPATPPHDLHHPQPPATPPHDLRTRPVPEPPPAQPVPEPTTAQQLPTLPPRPYSQNTDDTPPQPSEETNFEIPSRHSPFEPSHHADSQDVLSADNFPQSLQDSLASEEYSFITFPPNAPPGNSVGTGITSNEQSYLIDFDPPDFDPPDFDPPDFDPPDFDPQDHEDVYDRLWESNENIPALPEINGDSSDPLDHYSCIDYGTEPPPPPLPPSPPPTDDELSMSDSEEDPNPYSVQPKSVRYVMFKIMMFNMNLQEAKIDLGHHVSEG